ncbi:MAG: hypothetical protein MIO90_01500, partial [Methanomassiliicoccales archaeon]|nr:hypothetical protein [Methanomassiliicoccales archaeon]
VEKEETPGTEDIGPVEVAPSIEEEGIAVPDSVVAAEQLAELEPVVSEEPPVKEPEITVSTDSSDSTIRLKLVQVDEGPRSSEDDLVQEAHRPWFKPSGMVAMTTLGLGVVLYLIVLGLIAIGTLDIVSGLSVGAVTSAIIIYGAAVTYSSLRRKDRDEVFICPKCHETVDRCQGNCPACGASFRSED